MCVFKLSPQNASEAAWPATRGGGPLPTQGGGPLPTEALALCPLGAVALCPLEGVALCPVATFQLTESDEAQCVASS